MKTAALTLLAMLAFAANSVITRFALSPDGEHGLSVQISAEQFTLIRLHSGTVTLALLYAFTHKSVSLKPIWAAGHWRGGLSLFMYAACFSAAYIALPSGIGALVLFGCVQLTMLIAAYRAGETLSAVQIAGIILASLGLLWMLFPQNGLPPLPYWALAFMAIAGAAWGLYSVLGKSAGSNPVLPTSGHFARAALIAMLIMPAILIYQDAPLPNPSGVGLAVICGAVTSALGYAIWYAALRGLTAIRAATVQLSVPVFAALGGLLFIAEPITARFVISAVMVLGGVGIALSRQNTSKGRGHARL